MKYSPFLHDLVLLRWTNGLSKKLYSIFCIIALSIPICQAQKVTPILPLGHTQLTNAIDIHPNDKLLLSVSDDGSVKLCDVPSGLQILSIQAHDGKIYAAQFSPDGEFIVSAGQDLVIRLWKTGFEEPIGAFVGHKEAISSVAISKNNKWILSASFDQTIKLWDANSKKCIRTFSGHQNIVNDACFSADEKYIISGGGLFLGDQDNSIRVWEIASGESILTIDGHTDAVNSLSISPNGKYIASGSDDQTFRVWDIKTGKEKLLIQENSSVNRVCFSPDGQNILVGLTNNIIDYWNIKTKTKVNRYLSHTDFINSTVFSSNGKYFFSAGDDVGIKMWTTKAGQLIRTFSGQIKSEYASAFSKDGRYLATSSLQGQLKIWDFRTWQHLIFFWNKEKTLGANRLVFSPDSKKLISSQIDINNNNTIQIWDVSKGLLTHQFNGHAGIINDINISGNGDFLVSCSSDSVKLWDLNNLEFMRSIVTPYKNIMTVSFFNDQQSILIGTESNNLTEWGLDGEPAQSYTGFRSRIMMAKHSSDGKYILAGGGKIRTSELMLWDTEDKKLVKIFDSPHNGFINSLDISPDGRFAVSGAYDGSICLWDLEKKQSISFFQQHTDYINNVNFSKDGKHFISSSGDNTIKIWDFEKRMLSFTLFSFDNSEWAVIGTNNYYFCSKDMVKKMGFRFNNEINPFEQFDVNFNRPDLIAAGMPYRDSSLIKAFNSAYKTRLKKLGIKENRINNYQLPSIKLLNTPSQITTDNAFLSLHLKATDSLQLLNSLHISINDVPIYGRDGIDLRDENSKSIDKKIKIQLAKGKNKIQAYAINQAGISSLPITLKITNTNQKPPSNLHFIGLGASQYQQSFNNLDFADTDVRAMANYFNQQNNLFDNIYIDTLINKDYTSNNIKKLKNKLLQTKVNDCIILFIAGHGLRDNIYNYYLASYDADFSQPGIGAIPYSLIVDLLDGVPALRKLLLIDACFSGEIDSSSSSTITFPKLKDGQVKLRAIPSENPILKSNDPSFVMMRKIFLDLRQDTGSTIIVSSSGSQLSIEGEEWNNGLFTYTLLSGLKDAKADVNSNREIPISELLDYISTQVWHLSKGQQLPEARRMNLEGDWRLK